MADVLTPAQRQLNMSQIRARDTKPELLIRRGLHRIGFRYRLHDKGLPGSPDLVLPRHRVAIFVNGCFWHGHSCTKFRLPSTRQEFWQDKISKNRRRDSDSLTALKQQGWRTLTIWECALRGPSKRQPESLFRLCSDFIHSAEQSQAISGKALNLP